MKLHFIIGVPLGDNLALGKPTSQITTSWGGRSGRAVDGNRNSNWRGGSCTHTHSRRKSWWRVDLQKNVRVRKVFVQNRGDCCGSRLNPFEIRVGYITRNGGNSNPT